MGGPRRPLATGALAARAVEPAGRRDGADRRPTSTEAPAATAGGRAHRAALPCLRAARACPPHAGRLRARSAPRRAAFRREDLAHAAATRMAAREADARIYPTADVQAMSAPIALFLFVVFLSFAVFNLLGAGDGLQGQANGFEAARAAYEENAERIAKLTDERAALPASEAQATDEARRENQESGRRSAGYAAGVRQRELRLRQGFRPRFQGQPAPQRELACQSHRPRPR